MIFRPYPYKSRAIFDLAHLESLSDEPSLAFLMSPRSAYILQNLAAADVTDYGRYAIELLDNGYTGVQEEDGEYGVFVAAIDGVARELVPMSGWVEWESQLWQPGGAPVAAIWSPNPAYLMDQRGLLAWHAVVIADDPGGGGQIFIQGPGVSPVYGNPVGHFLLLRTGVGFHVGAVHDVGDDRFAMIVDGSDNLVGANPEFFLAAGDIIYMSGVYRVAVT